MGNLDDPEYSTTYGEIKIIHMGMFKEYRVLTLVYNLVSLLRWEVEDSEASLSSACVVEGGGCSPHKIALVLGHMGL